MQQKDYYRVLGVESTATQDEIKKAYRKQAKKYHPDVSTVADAETRFKAVNEAYDVLGNKKSRAEYDQFGSKQGRTQGGGPQGFYRNASAHGRGFHGGGYQQQNYSDFDSSVFDKIFRNSFHSSKQKQRPTEQLASISLNLEDIYKGTRKSVRLPSGGQVQVKIPAGIEEGKKIRLSGKGSHGSDLFLKVRINEHPHFTLKEKDVYYTLPLSPWEAAMGTTVTTPTLDGQVKLKIPAGTQSGKKMRLKGRGMPGNPQGDQYVVMQIQNPPLTSDQHHQIYRNMKKVFNNWNPRA